MMEQRLVEAKNLLKKKRRFSVCGLVIAVFYIIDPFHLTDGYDKVSFLFWALAIISVINIVTYFKDKPEDYIWDEEDV